MEPLIVGGYFPASRGLSPKLLSHQPLTENENDQQQLKLSLSIKLKQSYTCFPLSLCMCFLT